VNDAKKRSRWPFRIVLLLNIVAVAILSGIRPDIDAAELSALYANRNSKWVEVEGIRTHYRDEGSGPPLLLLHGTSSSLHTWDEWMRALHSHRRIIRLDLPGFGLTGPAPDADYRAERYARFIVAFLDALHLDRVDLAGNSLGGRIAATVTLTSPERVRNLILVDAAGLSGQKRAAVFRLATTPGLSLLARYFTPTWLIRSQLEEVYGDDPKVTDALVARHQSLLRRDGNRQALIDRLSGPTDPDLDGRLGEIRQPTLIEWGTEDPWIPLSFAERWHRGIAGSELRTYVGAGHVPMEERAE